MRKTLKDFILDDGSPDRSLAEVRSLNTARSPSASTDDPEAFKLAFAKSLVQN